MAFTFVACTSGAKADVLFYNLPGSNLALALEGATTINPGGTVTYQHPKFGTIHFSLDSVEIKRVPTIRSQFAKQIGRAGADADKRMEAAQWALRHGLLPQFWEAVDKALEANPQHERALKVKKLKELMNADLGDSTKQKEEMRALIGRGGMKFQESKHFVLMHDTPDKLTKGKTRAQERIELLETVYEAFLLRFYAYGVELQIPREKLKVVLFNNHEHYAMFAEKLSPGLSSASGFWSPTTNTSIFYDHGTNKEFKMLAELSAELQKDKKDAQKRGGPGAADIVRLADSISMLVEIEREDSDIEVVSHEATHQMAGNTGLLPMHVMAPSWLHEGLATYFETPDGATWGGIGAVNESRLDLYRTLQSDREHSNIDFIVTDQIFDLAGSHMAKVHGYGQAWALTHFLIERHFDKYMAFCRRIGEMPPDVKLSPDVVKQIFEEEIGIESRVLDVEWRAYMDDLKTDIELVVESL